MLNSSPPKKHARPISTIGQAADNSNDLKFISDLGRSLLFTVHPKKVAERVVVDLKSKVGLIASADATDFLYGDSVGDGDEAVQALVSLGYSLQDAKTVMIGVDQTLPLGKRVAEALKKQGR